MGMRSNFRVFDEKNFEGRFLRGGHGVFMFMNSYDRGRERNIYVHRPLEKLVKGGKLQKFAWHFAS